MRKSLKAILLIIPTLLGAESLAAQTQCLSAGEIKTMLERVNAQPKVAFDKKLREQLIKLKAKSDQRLASDVRENRESQDLIRRIREDRQKNAEELCKILKTVGWPSKALVGPEGVNAMFFLLRDSARLETQVHLLPVVIAATKLGELEKSDFASFIDLLRLKTGSKQLFGTQATIINGFLVLYPIEAEALVDERRNQYGLGPLAEHLRHLESIYRLPLIRSTGSLVNAFSDSAKKSVAAATSQLTDAAGAADEVIRVETNLVSLNVSVYSNKLRTRVGTLGQNDFTVTEDGQPQAVTFFAAVEVPFDLVLLLDLSGSTSSKRDLIRKSTQRFIEAARPSDRLAVVTFSDIPVVVAPLTEDRPKLLDSIKRIEGTGGSNVWDALKFTLDQVLGPKNLARRRAVVFMTDGADNSLLGWGGGSKTSFADLIEGIRRSDAMIIPIYLDTEGRDKFSHRIYENARKALALLADESGGLYYKARKIEDLNDVYDQVIADLGKVYSVGYRPTNEKRDGSWRAVTISLPNRPDLQARARPGYYAN